MSTETPFRPAGVVLTGGQSSRLGPGSKAFASLAGKAMIEHVIGRLQPQAEPLLLSVQANHPELEKLGLVSVPDVVQRHRGPLTGLCSVMQYLVREQGHNWLLMCPCDAPFLPSDLVARLYEGVRDGEHPVSVARYKAVVQPVFSLWNLSVYQQVRDAVMTAGRGGLMAMLDHTPHVTVDWPLRKVPPFFNVNTRADLIMAKRMLDDMQSSD